MALISCVVSILDTISGEIRSYKSEFDHEYVWKDGNYSCDCNRGIFFEQAGGEDADCECGDVRFKVSIQSGAGIILYRDEDYPEDETEG